MIAGCQLSWKIRKIFGNYFSARENPGNICSYKETHEKRYCSSLQTCSYLQIQCVRITNPSHCRNKRDARIALLALSTGVMSLPRPRIPLIPILLLTPFRNVTHMWLTILPRAHMRLWGNKPVEFERASKIIITTVPYINNNKRKLCTRMSS